MHLRRPIFLLGFQGGGTGILWDLLISHPDCLHPGLETNEIFWPNALRATGKRYTLLKSALRYRFNPLFLRVFSLRNRSSPYGVETLVGAEGLVRFVDEHLHTLKLAQLSCSENWAKYRGISYTEREAIGARLVAKNIEGCCFASQMLLRMYPETKFVSIIRNGLVYCESKLRHGRARTATEAGLIYRSIGSYILGMAAQGWQNLIVRYEDLISNPLEVLGKVYLHCDLDPDVSEFGLMMRSHLGRSENDRIVGHKYWYSSDELSSFFAADIGRRALGRLGEDQKAEFLTVAGEVMDRLGYDLHDDGN